MEWIKSAPLFESIRPTGLLNILRGPHCAEPASLCLSAVTNPAAGMLVALVILRGAFL